MTDIPEPTPELHDMIARQRNALFMKYFVLKPAGDDDYAAASRAAMFAYAKRIRRVNVDLANQVHDWAERENAEAFARSLEEPE